MSYKYEDLYEPWDYEVSSVDEQARWHFRVFRSIAVWLPVMLVLVAGVAFMAFCQRVLEDALSGMPAIGFVVGIIVFVIIYAVMFCLAVWIGDNMGDLVNKRCTKEYWQRQEFEHGELTEFDKIPPELLAEEVTLNKSALDQLDTWLAVNKHLTTRSPTYLVQVSQVGDSLQSGFYLFCVDGEMRDAPVYDTEIYCSDDTPPEFRYLGRRNITKSLLGKRPAIIKESMTTRYYKFFIPENSIIRIIM